MRHFYPRQKRMERNPKTKDYVCEACSQACGLHLVDFGIGVNEFWGVPGNDIQIALATTCCDSTKYHDREEDLDEVDTNQTQRSAGTPA